MDFVKVNVFKQDPAPNQPGKTDVSQGVSVIEESLPPQDNNQYMGKKKVSLFGPGGFKYNGQA